MKHYIAYLDILGAKNSSEKEDFHHYLSITMNFQNELLRTANTLKNGRIHFFSDCAFIESKDINSLIEVIRELRNNLFDAGPYFIRGAISEGILGAINGIESEDFIKDYYDNNDLTNRFNAIKPDLEKYKDKIRGTLFFSKDIAKVVQYESMVKGAAIYIDEEILNDIGYNNTVTSGYINNVQKKEFCQFTDIIYDEDYITDSFLEKLLEAYYSSNIYDANYGRYYLSVIISCINSTNFERLSYDTQNDTFAIKPPIFDLVINLRSSNKNLYNYTKGLEFVYFSLLNKVYSDLKTNNTTTKETLRLILQNKKHVGTYMNRLSTIPRSIMKPKIKNLLIKDISGLEK